MPVPVLLWIAMGVAVAILFLWRKFVAGNDYDLVNMHDASGMAIAKQEATAKTLAHLDRIMMILIVVTVVYGLAIGGFYVYDGLVNGGKLT